MGIHWNQIDEDISVTGSAKIGFDESIQNVATVGHVEMDRYRHHP